MNKALFIRNIATQGAVGYGKAPGTMATIMTIPLVYFLGTLTLTTSYYYLPCVGLFFLFGWYVVKHALTFFNEHDPSAIVIDEMVGFFVVFTGICVTYKTILLGFVLFRLFDIYKPFYIAHVDNMDGAWAIMLDDVLAALLSNLLLHMLLYLQII